MQNFLLIAGMMNMRQLSLHGKALQRFPQEKA